MSELGQQRKSSVGLGMSGVGGKAEVDFGRLDVSLEPKGDIRGIPRRHGFRYGARLFSLFREESMERRLAAILAADDDD